jgi:hypothetical protein
MPRHFDIISEIYDIEVIEKTYEPLCEMPKERYLL